MAEIKKAGASAVSGTKQKSVRKKTAAKRKTVAKKTVSKKAVAKKTASTRKAQSKQLSTDERRRLIAEAAYLKAERRRFEGGDPTADWLEAEKEIDRS